MQLDVDTKVQLLTGVLLDAEAVAKIIKRAPYILGFSEETLKVLRRSHAQRRPHMQKRSSQHACRGRRACTCTRRQRWGRC